MDEFKKVPSGFQRFKFGGVDGSMVDSPASLETLQILRRTFKDSRTREYRDIATENQSNQQQKQNLPIEVG